MGEGSHSTPTGPSSETLNLLWRPMRRHCLGLSLEFDLAEQCLTSEPCKGFCFQSWLQGSEVNVEPRSALPTSTMARGPHAPEGQRKMEYVF